MRSPTLAKLVALIVFSTAIAAGCANNDGGETANEKGSGGSETTKPQSISPENIQLLQQGLGSLELGLYQLQEHQQELTNPEFNEALIRLHDTMQGMHGELGSEMYGGMYAHMRGRDRHSTMHRNAYHMQGMHGYWSRMHHAAALIHQQVPGDAPPWMREAMEEIDKGLEDIDAGMTNAGAAPYDEGLAPGAEDVPATQLNEAWIRRMNRGMAMMDEAMHMLQDRRDELSEEEFFRAMMQMHDSMWATHHELGHAMYWCSGNVMHGMMHDMFRPVPGAGYHMPRMHHNWRGMHGAFEVMQRHMRSDPPEWMRDAMQQMEEGLRQFDEGAKQAGIDKAEGS